MIEIDPDFVLQTRISFGRRGGYLAFSAGMALLYTSVAWQGGSVEFAGTALITVGMVFVVLAFPYAAVQIVMLEARGQLDQRRLTGRAPSILAAALLTGSAWAFLTLGAVAVGSGLLLGGDGTWPVFWMMCAASAFSAVALLTAPRLARVDRALLVAMVVAFAAITPNLQAPRWITISGTALAAAVFLVLTPFAIRNVRRPSFGVKRRRARPSANRARRLRLTSWPDLARVTITAGQSTIVAAVLLLVIGPAIVLGIRVRMPLPGLFALTVLPLVLAGYECAARSRQEAREGGLDRLRLTAQHPWRLLAQLASGFALPLLAVSAAGLFTTAVARGVPPWVIGAWVLLAALFVFTGMAEGLRGRRPGAYLAPAILLATGLVSDREVSGMLAMAALTWLTMKTSVRSLETGAAAPLSGVDGAVAAAILGAIAALIANQPGPFVLLITGITALGTGFLSKSEAQHGEEGSILLQAVCAALAASTLVALSGNIKLTVTLKSSVIGHPFSSVTDDVTTRLGFVVTAGLLAATGIAFGRLAAKAYPSPTGSFVIRATPLAVGLVLGLLVNSPLGMQTQNALFQRTRLALDIPAVTVMLTSVLCGCAVLARKAR